MSSSNNATSSSDPLLAPSSNRLSAINYWNGIAYVGNVLVTYGFSVLGLFHAKTNAELAVKYQTLITPAGWAFSIWSVIFISQLVFTIAQFLPQFRSSPLVRDGVKYYYIGVCLAQMAWTASFTLEYISMSLMAMLSILSFLTRIVIAQNKLVEESETASSSDDSTGVNTNANNTTNLQRRRDFWLLRFPFQIHCGWIIAASFVNLNVVMVSWHINPRILIASAFTSLVGVVIIAVVTLFFKSSRSDLFVVVPGVLVWATAGIFSELAYPKTLITNTFTTNEILLVRWGSFLASSILATLIVYVAFFKKNTRKLAMCNNTNNEGNDVDDDDAMTGGYTALTTASSSDEL